MLILNETKTENILPIDIEMKEHILNVFEKSNADIRVNYPMDNGYLTYSQIKTVKDEILAIMNRIDELAIEDVDRTKTSISEIIEEEFDAEFAPLVLEKRLDLASESGTYADYQDAVREFLNNENL